MQQPRRRSSDPQRTQVPPPPAALLAALLATAGAAHAQPGGVGTPVNCDCQDPAPNVVQEDAGDDESFFYQGRMNWSAYDAYPAGDTQDFQVRLVGDEVAYNAFWAGDVNGDGRDDFAFTVYQRVACHDCHDIADHDDHAACAEDPDRPCIQAPGADETDFTDTSASDPAGTTDGESFSPYESDVLVGWVEVWGYTACDDGSLVLQQIGNDLWGRHANDLWAHVIMGMEDLDGDGSDELVLGGTKGGQNLPGSVRIFSFSDDYGGNAGRPRWLEIIRIEPDPDHTADQDQSDQIRFGYKVDTRADLNGDGRTDIIVGAKSWREGDDAGDPDSTGATFGFVMPDSSDAIWQNIRDNYVRAGRGDPTDEELPLIMNPWEHFNYKILNDDTNNVRKPGSDGGFGHYIRACEDADDDGIDEILAVHPWGWTQEDLNTPDDGDDFQRGIVYAFLSGNTRRQAWDPDEGSNGDVVDAYTVLDQMESAMYWDSGVVKYRVLDDLVHTVPGDATGPDETGWILPARDEIDNDGSVAMARDITDWPDVIFLGAGDGSELGKCSFGDDYNCDGDVDLFVSATKDLKGYFYELEEEQAGDSTTDVDIWEVDTTDGNPTETPANRDTRWQRWAGDVDADGDIEFMMPEKGHGANSTDGDLVVYEICVDSNDDNQFVELWRIDDEPYVVGTDTYVNGTADDMTGKTNCAWCDDNGTPLNTTYSIGLSRAWTAGDVNGDGHDDIIVGARRYPYKYASADDVFMADLELDGTETVKYYVGHGEAGTSYMDQTGQHPFEEGLVRGGKVYLFESPFGTKGGQSCSGQAHLPPPSDGDFDRDGDVDIEDLVEFLVAFRADAPRAADLNRDGRSDHKDVQRMKELLQDQ